MESTHHSAEKLCKRFRSLIVIGLGLGLILNLIISIYCVDKDINHKKCVKFIGKYYKSEQWERSKKSIDCVHSHGHWKLNRSISFDMVRDSADFGYHNDECEKVKNGNLWQYEYISSPKRCNTPHRTQHSTENLCKRLAGRSLIVIGDSMNFQYFVSLVNIVFYDLIKDFNLEKSRPFQLFFNADTSNKDSGWYLHKVEVPCNLYNLPKFNLSCMRSDRLDLFLDKVKARNQSIYPAPRLGTHKDFHEYDFIQELRENPNAVILMNRGAHFINTEIVIKDLKETLTYLLSRFKDMTFIWRTTATGHQAPSEQTFFELPSLFPPSYSELSDPPGMGHNFNYENFEIQNYAVKQMLSIHFPEVLISDVYNPTALRRDSRSDYLHYCIPGPTNEWVKLLFHSFNIIDRQKHYKTESECLAAK